MLMAHVQERDPAIAARLRAPAGDRRGDRPRDGQVARASAIPNCRALAQAAALALGSQCRRQAPERRRPERSPAPPPTAPAQQGRAEAGAAADVRQPATGPATPARTQPPPGYQNAAAAPRRPRSFRGVPPQQPGPGKRRLLIALLAVIVAAGAGVGVALGTGGSKGGGKGATGDERRRKPRRRSRRCSTGCRRTCAAPATTSPPRSRRCAQPFVATLADCHDHRRRRRRHHRLPHPERRRSAIQALPHRPAGPRRGPITPRATARRSTAPIPSLHGHARLRRGRQRPPLVGALWCDHDGTLWYLQSDAVGQMPIMTKSRTSIAGSRPRRRGGALRRISVQSRPTS